MPEKVGAMTGQGAGSGGPDPVEGVTLEQWAHVQAALASSAPSVTVRTCRRCGAPREAGTVYGDCGFCGTTFFPNKAAPT